MTECCHCGGTGQVTCPRCNGQGEAKADWGGLMTCKQCKGTGKVKCFFCSGTGVQKTQKNREL